MKKVIGVFLTIVIALFAFAECSKKWIGDNGNGSESPVTNMRGRFGQSLTAIAKLAPYSPLTESLSVHYSGGSTLSSDIAAWLSRNGVTK